MADEKKKDISQKKRAHPRVDFFSRVHVTPEDGTPIDVFSSNVSCGGIFLRSNQPLAPDKKVELEFETNNGMVHVDEGEIVWTRSFDPLSAGSQVSGMGIKFRSMSEQSLKKIETFIDETLNTSPTPASPLNKPEAAIPHQPTKSAPGISMSAQSLAPQRGPPSSARPPSLAGTPIILAPPENSSPPERTASPRPLASQRIPSGSQIDIKMDSVLDAQPTDERPAVSHKDDALDGEKFMTSLSPTPHKRVFLFAGFVLLVAVVTFFTMFLVRPGVDDTGGLDSAGTTPRTTSRSQPSSVSTTDAKKNEPPGAATATGSAKQAPASAQLPGKSDSSSKSASLSGNDITPPKATKADSNEQPMLANIKETATDQLEVGQPVFEKGPHGWQMVIEANRGVEIKHFTLNAPPRLAIDFPKASFTGKFLVVEAPTPAVAKLRVGKQEWGVRFVLDFQGNEAPAYKINVEPASITVSFSQKIP